MGYRIGALDPAQRVGFGEVELDFRPTLARSAKVSMSDPIRRLQQKARLGCPICWEWVPAPRTAMAVFSADGCLGGRCRCGAAFVIDETGRSGGQALLDAQAVACDGDLDRAMSLDSKVDYEVKTRAYQGPTGTLRGRLHRHSHTQPQAWFVKLKDMGSDK